MPNFSSVSITRSEQSRKNRQGVSPPPPSAGEGQWSASQKANLVFLTFWFTGMVVAGVRLSIGNRPFQGHALAFSALFQKSLDSLLSQQPSLEHIAFVLPINRFILSFCSSRDYLRRTVFLQGPFNPSFAASSHQLQVKLPRYKSPSKSFDITLNIHTCMYTYRHIHTYILHTYPLRTEAQQSQEGRYTDRLPHDTGLHADSVDTSCRRQLRRDSPDRLQHNANNILMKERSCRYQAEPGCNFIPLDRIHLGCSWYSAHQ